MILDNVPHLTGVRSEGLAGVRPQAREARPRVRQPRLNAGDRVIPAALSPGNVRLRKLEPLLVSWLLVARGAVPEGARQKIIDKGYQTFLAVPVPL